MKLLLDRILYVFAKHESQWLTGGDISRSLHEDGYHDSEVSIKRVINFNCNYIDYQNKPNLFEFIKVKNGKGHYFHKFRTIVAPPQPSKIKIKKRAVTASIFDGF